MKKILLSIILICVFTLTISLSVGAVGMLGVPAFEYPDFAFTQPIEPGFESITFSQNTNVTYKIRAYKTYQSNGNIYTVYGTYSEFTYSYSANVATDVNLSFVTIEDASGYLFQASDHPGNCLIIEDSSVGETKYITGGMIMFGITNPLPDLSQDIIYDYNNSIFSFYGTALNNIVLSPIGKLFLSLGFIGVGVFIIKKII